MIIHIMAYICIHNHSELNSDIKWEKNRIFICINFYIQDKQILFIWKCKNVQLIIKVQFYNKNIHVQFISISKINLRRLF